MYFPGRVSVSHSFRSGVMREEINPQTDGYLGSWSGESQFQITVEPKDGLYLLWRSAKRNPKTEMFDQIEILHPDKRAGRRNVYTATIGTRQGKDGWITQSPRNHISMAWITRDGNAVNLELWELAIVSQVDSNDDTQINFFLTIQLTQKSPLFRDKDNRLVTPDFPRFSDEDWDDVRRTVSALLTDAPSLPEDSKRSVPPKKAKKLADNQGKVLWYNLAGNNGIVVTNKGNAKVHWSAIQTDKRFKSLETGQLVDFDEIIPATDPRTRLQFEVRGVRVV